MIYTKRSNGPWKIESAGFGSGRILAAESGSAGAAGVNYTPYYQLTDHLGSVRTVFTLSEGRVRIVAQNDYYPFGLRHASDVLSHGSTTDNRYLFNGKEDQVLGRLGLLDYGARMYDPQTGRWFNMDPLAEKYSGISPYAYCGNNPVNIIDLDGREGIVVSGQPGDHKNKLHFLENGLDRATQMQNGFDKQGTGEKATWIVYNDGGEGGYDSKTLGKYQKQAAKAGITMQVVSSADEIVSYVNEKTGDDSRANDLISNFAYVGHATPGDLDVGFVDHSFINMITNESLNVSQFNKESFSLNANINLVGGCRTAVSPFIGKSVAEKMATKIGSAGQVRASDVRVVYPGGVVSDELLVKPNKGSVVRIPGIRKR